MSDFDNSINLLEELDSISKIHTLNRDDIDGLMVEFAKRIIKTLRIERLSVWLFNNEKTAIISMGEYDGRDKTFKKESILQRSDFPTYFSALKENKIIIVNDMNEDERTKAFVDLYSKPLNIISLMDIPLRICGELVGVMCFEKTGNTPKKYTPGEQTFAFSISLVFASTLEARHRRAAQHKLVTTLKEKELLIKEINHRVKNNFAILISLMRISKNQGLTTDPKILLEEYEQRIFSMLKIQDLLAETENYSDIKISAYIDELLKEFKRSHLGLEQKIVLNIEDSDQVFQSKSALHLGLIITEILLNSVKHTKVDQNEYLLKLFFNLDPNDTTHFILKIEDNSQGFDFVENEKKNTLGLSLIKDLATDLGYISEFPKKGRCCYAFRIPVIN